MAERIKCKKDTKIIYNYLNGKPKNIRDDEFNYPTDWPENYEEDEGKLYGIKSSTLFSLALATGVKNNEKKPIGVGGVELSNKENFPDYLMPIMNAIAIYDSEDGIDVLKKEFSDITKDAEEYANGGIHSLNSEYQNNMDGIINEWHMEIEQIIEDERIIERIDNL